MRKAIIPVFLLLAGVSAGGAAGLLLAPEKAGATDREGSTGQHRREDRPDEAGPPDLQTPGPTETKRSLSGDGEGGTSEYFRISKPFIIPVVQGQKVAGLVTMSLSIEASDGLGDSFFSREPKLRDTLLQVMFDHANTGGFDGAFTLPSNLDPLRNALTEAAQQVLGREQVREVLILEIGRQDNL